MDPKVAYDTMLANARQIVAVADNPEDHPDREYITVDDNSLELADAVIALHQWRRDGGYDPFIGEDA